MRGEIIRKIKSFYFFTSLAPALLSLISDDETSMTVINMVRISKKCDTMN